MITALIFADDAVQDLHALLSALVPAAAEGLVRQVLVLDGGLGEGARALCEDAGADIVAPSLAAAAAGARGEWILAMPAVLRLRRGWDSAVTVHLERGGGAALVVDAAQSGGWLARLRPPAKAGVLMRRDAVTRLGEGADLTRLVRACGGRAPRLS